MKRLLLTVIFLVIGINSKGQLLKKDLIIGTEKDKIYFGLIQNIDVNSKGIIYVSDWNTKNIRAFTKDGELKQTIGRQGRGPGEFVKIDGSGLNSLDQIYAYDPTLIRVSIFDHSSNTVINTLNIPMLENNTEYDSKPRDIFVFNQSKKFLLQYVTSYSPGTGQMERKERLVLFNKAGEIVKQPLLTIREDQKLVQEQGNSISVGSLPFGRESLVEIGPDDRIYTAWTEELNIKIYNQEGKYLKSISDQIKKITVSDADLKQKNEEASSSTNYLDLTDQIPDTSPMFDWFEVDDQRRVWVAVNTEDNQNSSIRVYNQNGKVLKKTLLPKSVELKDIRDGYAYGIQKGKNGMQSVVRYKVGKLE